MCGSVRSSIVLGVAAAFGFRARNRCFRCLLYSSVEVIEPMMSDHTRAAKLPRLQAYADRDLPIESTHSKSPSPFTPHQLTS